MSLAIRDAQRVAYFLLLPIAFFMPFGVWQESLFGGLTVAKIIIPLIVVLIFPFVFYHLRINRISLYILAFSQIVFLSIFYGDETAVSIYTNFIGYFLLYIIVYNCVISFNDVERFLLVFFAGLVLITFLGMGAVITEYDVGARLGYPMVEIVFGLKRLLGTEENPNAFAVYYIGGIPIALYAFMDWKCRICKIFIGIIILLFLAAIIMTASRGAFLGVLVGCAVFFAYYTGGAKRRVLIFTILPLTLALVIFVPKIVVEHISLVHLGDGDPTNLLKDKELSTSNRLEVIAPFFDIYLKNPWAGVGYGNLSKILPMYHVEQNSSHNIFVGVLLEMGTFALILFLLIIAETIYCLRRAVLEPADKRSRKLLALIMAVILGQLANGLFHEDYISIFFWSFIAIAGAIIKLERSMAPVLVEICPCRSRFVSLS